MRTLYFSENQYLRMTKCLPKDNEILKVENVKASSLPIWVTYYSVELTDKQLNEVLAPQENTDHNYIYFYYSKLLALNLDFKLFQLGAKIGAFTSNFVDRKVNILTLQERIKAQRENKVLFPYIGRTIITFRLSDESGSPFSNGDKLIPDLLSRVIIMYTPETDEIKIHSSIKGEALVDELADKDDPLLTSDNLTEALKYLKEVLEEKGKAWEETQEVI